MTSPARRGVVVTTFLLSLSLSLSLLATTAMADGARTKVDWSARAKATAWVVQDDATILTWVRNVSGYDVVLIHKGNSSWNELTIRIEKDGKGIHQWDGHEETPLVVVGDILYYSLHSPISSGATIVAVDLTTGKQKWKTAVKGLGPINHSKYRNRVNLQVAPDVITVEGEESSGSYVELLDPRTGKTLATELRKTP